jgi:hypothetical protein
VALNSTSEKSVLTVSYQRFPTRSDIDQISVQDDVTGRQGVAAHLTIVKRPINSDAVHILIRHSRHLLFLDGRDPSVRVENVDGDVLLST